MKNFDSRTYSINDFLEWKRNNQLELSPKFQRRSVWTDTGRSFLMDTIIRGLPIPKVFIRQKINVQTRNSIREVVDGQQRLSTILSFINDGFKISKKHNSEYGGYYFSQLGEINPDIQASILNYEISVDLLVNMPDPQVLDVFSRLNSYAVVLNEQEKINANHFGQFKQMADELSKKHYCFWIDSHLLSEQKIFRMEDVSLTADLLISMFVGIKEKQKIKYYYDRFESDFSYDIDEYSNRFDYVLNIIHDLFNGTLCNTQFKRIPLFYSLFTSIYHLFYGLPEFEEDETSCLFRNNYNKDRIAMKLDEIERIFRLKENGQTENLSEDELKFVDSSGRATANYSTRKFRTQFLINLLIS